jgi:SAF domain
MHIYEERATKVEEQGRQALSPTIRLHANDDVVIARHHLPEGATLPEEGGLAVSAMVPAGHKVATRRIAAGEPVRRYNQIIGVAKQDIEPGQHVHTHNLAMAEFARDYAFCADAKPTEFISPPATFMGIVRSEALSREPERDHKGPANGSGQAAAVAICHACIASALKSRRVQRETRWR